MIPSELLALHEQIFPFLGGLGFFSQVAVPALTQAISNIFGVLISSLFLTYPVEKFHCFIGIPNQFIVLIKDDIGIGALNARQHILLRVFFSQSPRLQERLSACLRATAGNARPLYQISALLSDVILL